MSEKILALLVQFVTRVISAGGYAGIVRLMSIESACIPLPSEIIMPFAGYLVYLGRFNLYWAATAALPDAISDRPWRTGLAPKAGVRWWSATEVGPGQPPRSGPDDILLQEVRLDRGSDRAHAAGGATFIAFPAGIAKMTSFVFTFTRSLARGRGALCLRTWAGNWANAGTPIRVSSRSSIAFIWSWNWRWWRCSCGSCGHI